MRHLAFLLCLLAMVGCKVRPDDQVSAKAKAAGIDYQFLDVAAAQSFLTTSDGAKTYLDQLTVTHMSIQLKDAQLSEDRNAAMETYLAEVRDDVLPFSPEEKTFVREVLDSAFTLVHQVNPALTFSDIKLIKVTTDHYGSNVFYTLGNAIVFPANIFEGKMEVGQRVNVALHEIWHLLSRRFPSLRDELYGLIGFYRHNYDLDVDNKLASQLLTNPDGTSSDYAIKLAHADGGPSVEGIPLIRSVLPRYREEKPQFFEYLLFDIYQLDTQGNRARVSCAKDGSSTMDIANFQDFFKQIKDNTQYIIHPDEIIADNFQMAVKAYQDQDYSKVGPEGKKLLNDVLQKLIAFKAKRALGK